MAGSGKFGAGIWRRLDIINVSLREILTVKSFTAAKWEKQRRPVARVFTTRVSHQMKF